MAPRRGAALSERAGRGQGRRLAFRSPSIASRNRAHSLARETGQPDLAPAAIAHRVGTMRHGPYIAALDFDDDAGIFTGRVLNLRPQGGRQDGIGFRGSSVDELRKSFRVSVEVYEEECRRQGREPAVA